jgi:hypothetical protein
MMKKNTKTSIEKRDAAEAKAFIAYKEVLDAAFKADGFRCVVEVSHSLAEQVETLVTSYSDKKSMDAKRREVADFIETMWTGLQLATLLKIEAAGGIDAYREGHNSAHAAVVAKAMKKIDDITKDAPIIPGLAVLEEKYGAGNIPLTAVHESDDLDFKTKKFLFSLAGIEYDGNGPVDAKPKKTKGKK